jgi:perosamine synthetase
MTEHQRRAALKSKLSRPWPAEPLLGSHYGEEEIEAVVRCMRTAMDPCVGFGFICEEIEEFERAFAEYVGAKYCVSINGAGGGLDMAVRALDLEPGDEVIVPSVNFRAALMSVIGHGGKLVVCEVDPQTLCADPNDVEKKMTPRTRAILPTHMNGLSADMEALEGIAARYPHPKHGPAKVIGDAARALGGGYQGTKIGARGWMTVFSFHTQKCITTLGEGGAITTDDPELWDRLQGIRQFGSVRHNPDPMIQGYGWGSNYKMTKVQAVVGMVQLGRLPGMIESRRRLAKARDEMLDGSGLQLPYEPPGYEHCYYLYSLLVPEEWAGEKRDRLMAVLRDRYGVDTVVANPPVHKTVPYVAMRTQGQELPFSEEVAARLFCPPIHPFMPDEDNEYIAAAIWEAMEEIGGKA